MTTYRDSGVDIEAGDHASRSAYNHAKKTFASRNSLIGQPVQDDGGFAGFVDMGDFYYSQCCDTVGTKIMIAEETKNFQGLGYDLLCMVADDAVCTGAETVSITNTFETQSICVEDIDAMMDSLARACIDQKVAIVGGEIAEVGAMTNGTGWGADAVGIVEKNKVITGKKIAVGDVIIGLASDGFRCNGLSLVRKILADAFGTHWYTASYSPAMNWSQAVLTPSRIYSDFILSLIGRFKQPRHVDVHGIVHMTGGGMHNLFRALKDESLGITIDEALTPKDMMLTLQQLGDVPDHEAYRVWNMGMGMALIVDQNDADAVKKAARDYGIEAQIVGRITAEHPQEIHLVSQGHFSRGETLVFKRD